MKKIIILLGLCLGLTLSYAGDVEYKVKDTITQGEKISLSVGSYKILEFNQRITDIRVSNSDILSIKFETNGLNPLQSIKVFAKQIGSVFSIITFADGNTRQLQFSVTNDILDLTRHIQDIAKDVEVQLVNNSIILKGDVKNNKIKNTILKFINDANSELKIVDLLHTIEPDQMIRLKLYITEIDNAKGETLKNNWALNGGDKNLNLDISSMMLSSVSLSGGLTASAQALGNKFNPSLTLNYLKTNGVVNVLDETTLISTENKKADFLAGGTLNVRITKDTADGTVSEVQEINYGLQLQITVKEIVAEKYLNLEISTSSSSLDLVNAVDGIPGKKDKTINTNVIVEDGSTIVLGGLVNKKLEDKDEKIPLLGDIPLLGALFRSSHNANSNSELVFFITPEIVDVTKNNQIELLQTKQNILEPKQEQEKVEVKVEEKNDELPEKQSESNDEFSDEVKAYFHLK